MRVKQEMRVMNQGPEAVSELLPKVMEAKDLVQLRQAHEHLEHPSLAARLSSIVGTPIEVALQLLPKRWYRKVQGATEKAIHKSLNSAITSMQYVEDVSPHESYYKLLVGGVGAVGGFFGLPGLLFELPITTTLMLRSIAEIADSAGEDIKQQETQAACLQVFALGGRSELDDAADTGYYGVRLALATYWRSGAIETALHGGTAATGLIQAVATRFGVNLSQRAAAHMVPIAGAASGALINVIFMQHFQDMARSHFTVRQLERKYGAELVQRQYDRFDQEK
jgi:hypothetical protein